MTDKHRQAYIDFKMHIFGLWEETHRKPVKTSGDKPIKTFLL